MEMCSYLTLQVLPKTPKTLHIHVGINIPWACHVIRGNIPEGLLVDTSLTYLLTTNMLNPSSTQQWLSVFRQARRLSINYLR